MKDAESERRLEALFLQGAPERDPEEGTPRADQRPEHNRLSSDTQVDNQIAASATQDTRRRRLLRVLIPASVLGEAAATAVLIIVLYRYSPPQLRSSYFLYISATLAGLALLLLFAQWLLARRLAQAEKLTQKRARQLNQASTLIREYQRDLEWTQEVARGRGPERPRD